MKILVFTYGVTRKAGGVCDAVRDLFTNDEFGGQSVQIMSFEDEFVEEDLVKWGHIPVKLFKPGFMLSSGDAKRALLNAKTDILHMEALWRCPHLWMSDWKKVQKKPIVCSPHGMLDPYIIHSQGFIKRIVSKCFFQNGLEAVDCFHALCHKELEDIRLYGLKQPVAIIPNGVNLPPENLKFKKQDKRHHLLYLGRLHQKKGVDLLLLAIAQIKEYHPELLKNWIVDLVGWDHENCKAVLENLVQKYNLKDYVVFHGGLFGEEKQRMYATADAYILPSHGEGLPMTVLEAWSWKLPVIMTPQCHIPEGFGASAAIRIEDNAESTKNGIIKFLSMGEDERIAMGNNGFKLVSEHFTWSASARKMIQLYKWLLGQAERPSFVYL